MNTHGRLMLANGQHEVEFPVDQCMNFHADNLLCMKTVCALPRWRAIKSFTARLTTLLAVALSLMKSILASRIAHRLKFLIRTVQQPICKNIVRKPGCHSRPDDENELALHSKEELEQHLANVWEVMRGGIERGISTEGVLPGKLRVPRRAAALRRMLVSLINHH